MGDYDGINYVWKYLHHYQIQVGVELSARYVPWPRLRTTQKIYNVDTEIVLNKTRVVVGTEAMHVGISSNYMKYYLYWGIPSNLHVLMQTMGHVDPCLDAVTGSHIFEILLSFDTLVTIFICIKQG